MSGTARINVFRSGKICLLALKLTVYHGRAFKSVNPFCVEHQNVLIRVTNGLPSELPQSYVSRLGRSFQLSDPGDARYGDGSFCNTETGIFQIFSRHFVIDLIWPGCDVDPGDIDCITDFTTTACIVRILVHSLADTR